MAILYWLYTSQESAYLQACLQENANADCNFLDKLKSDFSSVNWWWVIAVLFIYALSNVSRAFRWQILLRSAGHPIAFSSSFISIVITYFANSIIPRSGEVARAAYITKLEDVPMEKALGTIAVGRTIDVISLLIVIAIGFAFEAEMLLGFLQENGFDPIRLLQEKSWLIIVGIAGLILLGILYTQRKRFSHLKPYQAIEEKMIGFWNGILSIRQLDKPLLFIFHSVFIWLMYYLMTYVAFFCFPPVSHLTPVAGLMVFIVGTFGMLIPSPGGMGAYQFLVGTCLTQLYGIAEGDAFSYSNIIFFPIYIFNITMGFLAFLYLSLTGKQRK